MAYELREGQGSLFKNDRREKESHPNAKGRALIGGVEYWVSAWVKEGAKGKWQSLSFEPVQKNEKPVARNTYTAAKNGDFDDVPF